MNGFGFDADFCRDFNRFRVRFVGIRLRVRIGEREKEFERIFLLCAKRLVKN